MQFHFGDLFSLNAAKVHKLTISGFRLLHFDECYDTSIAIISILYLILLSGNTKVILVG